MNNKTLKTIAGIIFLGLFAYYLWPFINIIASGALFYTSPIYTILTVIRLVCLAILGISSLNNKKLGKISIAVAIVYVVITIYSLASVIRYYFPTIDILIFVIFIAAYVMAMTTKNGSVFNVKDTVSEAAKVQFQAEKQTLIYEQQLKDGIITQEEYDQLSKKIEKAP